VGDDARRESNGGTTVSLIRRHPLATYFVLAFAMAWWTWPLVLLNPKSSPMLPWSPIFAAIIVLALTEGRAGIGALLRSTFRWRVKPIWYAAALGIPFALWAGAAALAIPLGARPDTAYFADFVLLPVTMLTTAIVKGPLTEEPGWRGFALPRLLERWSPLVSSLLLGVIWFAWHLPLLLQDASGAQRPLVPYFVAVLAMSVIATWLWSATTSVFLVILFHTAINSIGSHIVPAFAVGDQLVVWVIFAVAVAAVAGAVTFTREFRASANHAMTATPRRASDVQAAAAR
jgi:membrane protease YdiL (CAAX protease family)